MVNILLAIFDSYSLSKPVFLFKSDTTDTYFSKYLSCTS